MNDRGNQITLGTFVATFLYCLLVLRTVRGGDDSSASFIFVPNFAILVGLLMAIASLGVLIYFIHHIPESIHISQTIARVGKELLARIEAIYPSRIGKDAANADLRSSEDLITPPPFEDTRMVTSATTGFVQYINDSQLIEAAQKHDLVLWIVRRPGDFATPEQALVLVKPAGVVDDTIMNKIRAAFILGTRRTPSQDVLFLVDQLVEVAIRALSPGINDPMTAIYCINWLSAALGELAGHTLPSRYRLDSQGQIRIVAMPVDYADFTDAVFGKLRPYVQCDRNAALHMLDAMSDLIAKARTETQKSLIRSHCEALRHGCASSLPHPADLEAIDHIFEGAASRYVDFKDRVPTEKTGDEK